MTSRPARVVMTIGSARLGGAEGQLTKVAAGLRDRGHDVSVVFTAYGGPHTEVLDAAGVPWCVARLPIKHISGLGREIIMILRIGWFVRRARPDVIMAWLPGAIWSTLLISRAISRAKRIAALRGESLVTSPIVRCLLRRAMASADVITVNSPHLIDEAELVGGDRRRVVVLPNGVFIPSQRAEHVATQPPVAVVVANFRHYKGHDVLVRALAKVDLPLHVRLLGEGDHLADTAALAEQLGVGNRLTFVDYPGDVRRELASAQFAIHPSRTEGLSNAILEELAAGLPVVATNVGGTALLIKDGSEGFLVEAGDDEALAAAMTRLASDPTLRQRMATSARAHAETFSVDACIDRFEKLVVSESVSNATSREVRR